MNKYQTLPQTRWNYTPMQGLRDALSKLEEAKVIGQQCDRCHKVLVEKIVIHSGSKFHFDCWV